MIESKKKGEIMAEAKVKKEAKPIKVNVDLEELSITQY